MKEILLNWLCMRKSSSGARYKTWILVGIKNRDDFSTSSSIFLFIFFLLSCFFFFFSLGTSHWCKTLPTFILVGILFIEKILFHNLLWIMVRIQIVLKSIEHVSCYWEECNFVAVNHRFALFIHWFLKLFFLHRWWWQIGSALCKGISCCTKGLLRYVLLTGFEKSGPLSL